MKYVMLLFSILLINGCTYRLINTKSIPKLHKVDKLPLIYYHDNKNTCMDTYSFNKLLINYSELKYNNHVLNGIIYDTK